MKVPFILACLLPTIAFAQSPSGSYLGVNWQINENHTLLWNGQPYMPMGQEVQGTADEISKANAAGSKDLLVDLNANGTGWAESFAELNKNQDRFLLRVNSLAPMAQGIAVEPQGYRVANVNTARHFEFRIPDATNALVLLVNQTDSTVVKSSRMPIINGKFSYDAPDINGMNHVLLVYPEMRSLKQPDFWEGFDERRDSLLNALKRNAPGAGLRGIVNPLGQMLTIPGPDARFVPTSSFFRDELSALLASRYRSVETASKAWSISAPDFAAFGDLSRLIPLWSSYRGVPQFWDPATDHLYLADNKRSTAWKDINDAIQIAATRRFRSLVAALRQVTNVPVVQEWAGWSPPYDGADIAIDGVGVRSSGSSPSAQIDSSGRAVSSLLRWNRPGWLVATDVQVGSSPDGMNFDQAAAQLGSMGVRACFGRSPSTSKAMDGTFSSFSPTVLYFPENATNPPAAQKLPGGMWWLPSPVNGDRIDLGSRFAAYRLQDGANSFTALWSPMGAVKTTLRFTDIKSPKFETIDGSNPNIKMVKNGIELTLSDVPLIIRNTEEIPVPDPAVEETIDQFSAMLRGLGVERGAVSEEQYYFTEAARGFDRNPGGSLIEMRRVLRLALIKVAPYAWIEAENCQSHNFSEIATDPGCSGKRSLVLDTKITPADGFQATYNIPVRNVNDQELWMAARIPEAYRDSVTVLLAGTPYKVPNVALSSYGDGYAWYKLGTVKLAGKNTTLKVVVTAPDGADMAFDTFLIYPGGLHPNGVQMPIVATGKAPKETKAGYTPIGK